MKISIDDSIMYGRYHWLWVITMAIGNGSGYGRVYCRHEESMSMAVAMVMNNMASPYCLDIDRGQTNRQTDRQTNKARHRVATQLKR